MSKNGCRYRSDGTTPDENSEPKRRGATDETADESESATEDETESEEDSGRADRAHLDDVADGSGCTEIWEHLSEQRDTIRDE